MKMGKIDPSLNKSHVVQNIMSTRVAAASRFRGGARARSSELPVHRPCMGLDDLPGHFRGLEEAQFSGHCTTSSSSSSSSAGPLPKLLQDLHECSPSSTQPQPQPQCQSEPESNSHSGTRSRDPGTPDPDMAPARTTTHTKQNPALPHCPTNNHSWSGFKPRHSHGDGGLSNSSTSVNSCSTTSIRAFPEVFRGPLNESFSSYPSTSGSASMSFPLSQKHKGEMVSELGSPQRASHAGSNNQAAPPHSSIGGGGGSGPQIREGDLDSIQYTVSRVHTLVLRLQSEHLETRRAALKELRLLAKHDDDKRMVIFDAGAVGPLLKLMDPETSDRADGDDPDQISQQEATATLLNLSLNHHIRGRILASGNAIESLVRTISHGLSSIAMENAAVALVNLVGKDEDIKAKVGSMGVIPPLLELLHNGSDRGKKDAATTLYSLSSMDDNKRRMVRGGATRLLLQFISDEGLNAGMMEKSMAILRNLVSLEEGRVAFVAEGGIKFLLEVIHERGSRKSQELALLILFQLCRHSSRHRTMVLNMNPLLALSALHETTTNGRFKSQIYEVIQILEEHKSSLIKRRH